MKLNTAMRAITCAMWIGFGILGMTQTALSDGPKKKGIKSTVSMDEVLKECKKHHQETVELIDQMTDTLKKAKELNDPEIMRKTIDQVQITLADMKEHLSICLNLMSRHGDMDKQKGGSSK